MRSPGSSNAPLWWRKGLLLEVTEAVHQHGLLDELHTVMAGNVLVTLPAFIIFFIAQKRFIQGIVTTGIKG